LKKIAIVTTHPIQYNAPCFRLLQERKNVKPKVFYTWEQTKNGLLFDQGFGRKIQWDIPLLAGYEYTFTRNISSKPGSHRFYGIINPTLCKEIEEWKPDAILIFGWSFQSHLNCMRYFKGKVPVFFRGDSTLLTESKGLRKVLRTLFLKWVYTKIDYALYVGNNNKNYYLRHGIKEKQLIFVPHAVDNRRFLEKSEANECEALKWRQELNIQHREIVFLYAGKLTPQKQPELLIRAFSEITKQGIHLIIVGNGEEEEKLKSLFLGVDNLHFIDFQNQSRMPVVYHLADIFVLPSSSETWGLAINEAMACKRAVLASDKCGGAIDLIKEGVNGYIFESGNRRDLVERMNKFIMNRNNLNAMGYNSFEIVQQFSFDKICGQIELLLKQC
jgi:glycosyltransferase involved in cell wall biosynthesis